jgi:hypothetical protein
VAGDGRHRSRGLAGRLALLYLVAMNIRGVYKNE